MYISNLIENVMTNYLVTLGMYVVLMLGFKLYMKYVVEPNEITNDEEN